MKKNLTQGQQINILCYNYKTKQSEWKKGVFTAYCSATDIDFRIECVLDSGVRLAGQTAAHPDCVKPQQQ